MALDQWGPFATDLDPAERLARLRSLRALARVLVGPGGQTLADLLHRAETDDAALSEAMAALEALPALPLRKLLSSYAGLTQPTRKGRPPATHEERTMASKSFIGRVPEEHLPLLLTVAQRLETEPSFAEALAAFVAAEGSPSLGSPPVGHVRSEDRYPPDRFLIALEGVPAKLGPVIAKLNGMGDRVTLNIAFDPVPAAEEGSA